MKKLLWSGVLTIVWFSLSPAAVGQNNSVWDSNAIDVCWENPSAASSEELDWVQAIIGTTWEGKSQLVFYNWYECEADSQGIRILIDDQRPHVKALGKGLDGLKNGMVLNFDFNNWSQSCAQGRRQFCIQSTAIHMFGHAIGIAPGENESCDDAPAGDINDIRVGSDAYSVMNQCGEEWNGDILLGEADILVASDAYGYFHDSEFQESADICSVTASGDDGNVPENTLDYDPETRWSAKGDGQWIEYSFCDAVEFNQLDVAWYRGTERFADFEIETRYQGSDWTSVFSGPSFGWEEEQYFFAPSLSEKVRIVGYGNTSNSWNSIVQVFPYFSAPQPEPELNKPSNLSAIAEDSQNVFVSWNDESIGHEGHVIEVSVNGSEYRNAGVVDQYGFEFFHNNLQPGTHYEYRVSAIKNGEKSIATTTSVTTPGSEPQPTELSIVSITASSHDGNLPSNVIDNDFNTRWSAKGNGQWIEFDLGGLYDVRTIEIAWYKGDEREASFSTQARTNEDGDWQNLGSDISSGQTLGFETFTDSSVDARFIRVIGRGNTSNEWNSMTEIRITGFSR